MPSMVSGRVILLGDAAWCLTLYSGTGASSGMAGAVALGDALDAPDDDIDKALARWQSGMMPRIKKWRSSVPFKKEVFVPSNGFVTRIRRSLVRRGGRMVYEQRRGKVPAS